MHFNKTAQSRFVSVVHDYALGPRCQARHTWPTVSSYLCSNKSNLPVEVKGPWGATCQLKKSLQVSGTETRKFLGGEKCYPNEGSLICPPGKAVISSLPNILLLATSLFLLVTFSFALRNQKGTIESLFLFLQRHGFVAVLVRPCHVYFDQRVSWQGSISFWMCLQLRNCDRSGYSSFHSWGYKQ